MVPTVRCVYFFRQDTVLDRVASSLAVAAVHHTGGAVAVRGSSCHYLGVLHHHCAHHLEQKQEPHSQHQTLQQQG